MKKNEIKFERKFLPTMFTNKQYIDYRAIEIRRNTVFFAILHKIETKYMRKFTFTHVSHP